MSIGNRPTKLETASLDRAAVVIWHHHTETNEQAKKSRRAVTLGQRGSAKIAASVFIRPGIRARP